jgi:hypothetical protein
LASWWRSGNAFLGQRYKEFVEVVYQKNVRLRANHGRKSPQWKLGDDPISQAGRKRWMFVNDTQAGEMELESQPVLPSSEEMVNRKAPSYY